MFDKLEFKAEANRSVYKRSRFVSGYILNKPLVAERRTGLSTMFRDITRGNEKVFINISAP